MKNLLLSQLGQDDFNRLEPYLKLTPFMQHSVLFEAEQEIKHVYFPTTAVVSLVVTLESGACRGPNDAIRANHGSLDPRYVGNPTLRRALALLIGEPDLKDLLSFECYCSAEEVIRNSHI